MRTHGQSVTRTFLSTSSLTLQTLCHHKVQVAITRGLLLQLERVTANTHYKVRLHNKRLNRHLTNNGMEKCPVYADGNCFFKAASLHLQPHDTVSLRAALCQHLRRNIQHDISFFTCTMTDEALAQIYAM
ncbi:hypothetical protein V1264_011043 [Littorina saxatilis]|uniref:OTU domain-containing protein n=1 Tax=Littorina saxatilis TaxID=31220 RepID=A0AAN9B8Z2_9CAEN